MTDDEHAVPGHHKGEPSFDTDRTGYCNPPKEHRFQKGHKGYTRKKPSPLSLQDYVQAEMETEISYKLNGKTRKATNGQLIAQTAVRSAAKGDRHARRDIIKLTSSDRRTRRLQADLKEPTSDMTDKQAIEALMAAIKASKL